MTGQHTVFARKLLMRLVRAGGEDRCSPGTVETMTFEIMRLPVAKHVGAAGDRKRIGFSVGDGIVHGEYRARIRIVCIDVGQNR